jgi:predicted dehydrogenase
MPVVFDGNPKEVLRVALIGCGAVSQLFYAPALLSLQQQELITIGALVDPDPGSLSLLCKTFPQALAINKLTELDCSSIDLAIIASPQRYHCELAVTLLNKSVHVLCEKPLASNLQEAENMVEAALNANRLLAVGLFRRFWPITEYITDVITSKGLGDPIHFDWAEGGIFDWPSATPSFFRKDSSPGGVFADLGSHVLDLLMHWFGPVAHFDYRDDAMGGLEANAILLLDFKNGVSGQLRLSRDTPIPSFACIEFERGTLAFQPGNVGEVSLVLKDSTFNAQARLLQCTERVQSGKALWAPTRSFVQSFMEQIVNIIHAIRGKESLLVPATEALASIALIDQCYANRQLMDMPWLTEVEDDFAQKN